MRRRKSSDVLDGQEKITKYVTRSRIPAKRKEIDVRKRSSSPTKEIRSLENPSSAPKFKDSEVRVTRKGNSVRKKNATPVDRLRSSRNPSSVPKRKDAEVEVTQKGIGIRKKITSPAGRLRSSKNPSSAPKLSDSDVKITNKGSAIRNRSSLFVGRLRSTENPSSVPKLIDTEVKVTRKGRGSRKRMTSPEECLRILENPSSAEKPKDVVVQVTRKGTGIRKKSTLPVGRLISSENPSSALMLKNAEVKIPRKGTGIRKKSTLPVERLISSENPSSALMLEDAEVKVTRKGTNIRKERPSPVERFLSLENPSSAVKLKVTRKGVRGLENPSLSDTKGLTGLKPPRYVGALWNRAHILETAAQVCSDPYDFDTSMTESDLKENRQPERKSTAGKAPPKKKSKNSIFAKPKTVGAVRNKPFNARNIIPLKETSATPVGERVTKLTVADTPSGELSSTMEVEVERRERHFEKSSIMVASPESILGGLLEVCVEQKMANKCSEISISLYQDPDVVLALSGTPFPTKDKLTEQECCTSTPQTIEDVAEPVGPSSISPILKSSRPRLQALDLNTSGFSAEKNARTYRRDSHPKACRVVDSAPSPVVGKKKTAQKRKKKYKLPKHFDKWATSANETLIEAENFELVIE